jgi:hypothetical protein
MYSEFGYVVIAGPFFKIGRTKDVTRRIAQLSIQLPFPIQLFKVINTDDAKTLEAMMHRKFAEFRVNGEWFELDRDSAINLYIMPATFTILDSPRIWTPEWDQFLDHIWDYVGENSRDVTEYLDCMNPPDEGYSDIVLIDEDDQQCRIIYGPREGER